MMSSEQTREMERPQAVGEGGDALRVGLVGAGTMGRAIANQIINSTPGMELAVIANRTPEKAIQAFAESGIPNVSLAEGQDQLQDGLS